ncbi:hypothetical protein WN48_07065 [Eufriesea mexicana]|uniref:CHK kinase-like domain-containing protein n=1 Tax=Eufriesea mexicana TaxID=516756 RepID=A0A310SSR3_9HYME|nr:PREDICTED: uncharacterized protein LOC108552888 [Eufriesea mexicana]XP_017766909.1 PREDICTED: uncharacterized protein LOC108555645 [Eufriesea mexicana]OAD60891.1 hypothetical protein WN48_03670 [Eufriesea mexicana]OAD62867.1 hypothetical protein WN48_07065 [Eufriesea mexicana]
MCEQPEDDCAWIDDLMGKIADKLDKNFDDIRYEVSTPTDSFCVSTLTFLNVIANSSSDNSEKQSVTNLVVKRMSPEADLRQVLKSSEQFHNEILFYEWYGKHYDNLPRCIYAKDAPPADSVIVLENMVSLRGYSLSQLKYDISLDYTLAAVREMARFHANSYAMKEHRREDFFAFVDNIQEARFYPETNVKMIFDESATRSVEYLCKQGYDEGLCDKLQARFENTYNNLILKYVEPEEPLAILCHGDFTINNTLFKKKNGELTAMLIDFALIRYGSPILDLSTFLSLHCANDLDKDMLQNVLEVYHKTLIENLEENGVDSDKFTYEALYEEYKRKGLFGFFIASFFLSVQMDRTELRAKDASTMDMDEWARTMRTLGGDEVSEILANMLLRLKDAGCLDHVLH